MGHPNYIARILKLREAINEDDDDEVTYQIQKDI